MVAGCRSGRREGGRFLKPCEIRRNASFLGEPIFLILFFFAAGEKNKHPTKHLALLVLTGLKLFESFDIESNQIW